MIFSFLPTGQFLHSFLINHPSLGFTRVNSLPKLLYNAIILTAHMFTVMYIIILIIKF